MTSRGAASPRGGRSVLFPAGLVAAVATASPRTDPALTQDRVGAGRWNARLTGRPRARTGAREGVWAAVADGVGSLPESARAAQIAIDLMRRAAQPRAAQPRAATASGAFRCADEQIRRELDGNGATTLLTVHAGPDGATVRWVGNGALLLVASSPHTTSTGLPPPGVQVLHTDLLLPHIIFRDGRDVLKHVLGGSGQVAVETVVLGPSARGPRLLLAVTDGLHSAEQPDVGVSDDGSRWQRQTTALQAILALAGGVLRDAQLTDALSEQDLQDRLQQLLSGLLTARQLDDDASVAAVLLPAAQAH